MTVRNVALVVALAALVGAIAILWRGQQQNQASAPAPPAPIAGEPLRGAHGGFGASSAGPAQGGLASAPAPAASVGAPAGVQSAAPAAAQSAVPGAAPSQVTAQAAAPAGSAEALQAANQGGQQIADPLDHQDRIANQVAPYITLPDLPRPDDPNWRPAIKPDLPAGIPTPK
jgi:hypothetical protein